MINNMPKSGLWVMFCDFWGLRPMSPEFFWPKQTRDHLPGTLILRNTKEAICWSSDFILIKSFLSILKNYDATLTMICTLLSIYKGYSNNNCPITSSSLGTCYLGLSSYTPIGGSEPLTDSNFKYILANEEFSTSSFINSIQIISSQKGMIQLEVFFLFLFWYSKIIFSSLFFFCIQNTQL